MLLSTRATLGLLARYLRPQWRRTALLAALLFGSIALQVVAPQVVRAFIDAVGGGAPDSELTRLGVIFVAAALAAQGLRVGAAYVGEIVGWTATNGLRADLMRHCLRLDLGFHKTHTPGRLIERIDGDVTAMASFFSEFVIQILGNLLLVAGIVIALWLEDWRVGLAVALFTIVLLAAMAQTRTFALRHWRQARQVSAELYGFVEERLGGMEDLRSSGAGPHTLHRLGEHTANRVRVATRARVMAAIPSAIPVGGRMLGQAVALVAAAYLYGQGAITLGAAFLVVYYVRLTFGPIEHITSQLEEFQRAAAGITRVGEILATEPALVDAGTTALPDGPLSVEFEHVSFGYGQEEMVLRDVSFRLAPGEVLGLLGRTGAGKTSVVRLLARLYDPHAGEIRLDGVALRDVPLAELRHRVGMVTQDVQLFGATLRENLTLFDRTISDARVMAALTSLELAEWCRRLPRGLDTTIGPGGTGLSAGEAQLVAFTRLFLRDPGLVILDEASSRLDPATERLIERAVEGLLVGRTAIVIAHRLRTAERADRILVIEDGQVEEDGSRVELAGDPGSHYARLLRAGSDVTEVAA